MFSNIGADIRRYVTTEEIASWSQYFTIVPFCFALWVIISYRFGRWLREARNIPLITPVMKLVSKIIHAFLALLTGIQIPFEAKIGKGLYIGHFGTLIVNASDVIGEQCTLSTGVVIGQGGRGLDKGNPVLGNKVYVGVGAKILGKITVGNNVAIGANAVVVKDVPDSVTVAGIPARIVNNLGSADFI